MEGGVWGGGGGRGMDGRSMEAYHGSTPLIDNTPWVTYTCYLPGRIHIMICVI